jgi:hypothetical protein
VEFINTERESFLAAIMQRLSPGELINQVGLAFGVQLLRLVVVIGVKDY